MTLDELKKQYEIANIQSKIAWEASRECVPGGVTANVKFFSPFPIFMKEGRGAWLTDLDGHKYVDYVLSYGPLITGHGRAELIEKINSFFEEHGTTLYGAPHVGEEEFAKLLQKYYPSMEAIRYTNSGTEATLLSLRAAKAYTGRRKIGKFEGHYHGGFDQVLISTKPRVNVAGDSHSPKAIPESAGITEDILKDTVVLPFNDLESCERIIHDNQECLAGIIIEPFMGGTIPATNDFMHGLRKITEDLGIVLIFDEVKTGFRVGLNGAQGFYGIRPDITTMGKVLGGGFPLGIIGGDRKILDMAAPMGSGRYENGCKPNDDSEILYHSGTYNGHPIILALGIETIKILEREFESIIKTADNLKREIKACYAEHGVKILTPGVGTMFNICITNQNEIRTYRELKACDFGLRRKLDYAMMLHGVYCKPCTRYYLSTAHSDETNTYTLGALEKAWKMI